MTIKGILQGNWLGHPLHPAMVHLPTGLWPAALVFDLLSWHGGGHPTMAFTSACCIALGLLAAAGAIGPGLADWWDIKPEKPARKLGIYHMILNVIIFALFAVNLWLRTRDGWRTAPVRAMPLALSIIAVALLFVSGYLGGRMTYDQGISVARISKKQWRKIAAAGGANLPQEKGE